ncbi:DUF805 domain-containing protein [Pseudonocardia sp. TRM90224]|uniref:DUF805 domain-containing protein n=1 Tax=Pseudonocardia sp. TRM90224 TaxID=2812678 RepID=UPI001E597E08|nr:DUF805 domain-containing protein [Pseudonocardia sp. TRM90224]
MGWYLKVLKQYADFRGRARRTEYWMFTLVTVLVAVVLSVLDHALFGAVTFGSVGEITGLGWLYVIYMVATLIPSLAVSVRRLHDIDRSGWWVLIGFVPLVGFIVQLVFAVTEGTRGANRFGPDPKRGAMV